MTVDSELQHAHDSFAPRHAKRTRAAAASTQSPSAQEGIAASRPRRRRRPAWRSPLTRRILLLNVLVLLVPVIGLLHLDQYRQSLVDSELKAMTTQATTIALAIGSTAIQDSGEGQQQLSHETVRQLLRVLLASTGVRAKVFARGGELVGDSHLLTGPDGRVQVEELPPPKPKAPIAEWVGRIYDAVINGLPGQRGLELYREAPGQRGTDYEEVLSALEGEAATRLRSDSRRNLLLFSAVPVRRYRQVLAALLVMKDGGAIELAVRDRRHDVLLVFAVALCVTIGLSLYLAGTIAAPIRRLAEAADRVRGGSGSRARIPDMAGRHDEIGDLSSALIAMTDALYERVAAIEGFAADVAHEIKNPLTSLRSAVETVARVEDPAQQRKLMSVIVDDVQRLDRLISDISDASRLDAELARGESEEIDVARLLETLAEVHQAAMEQRGLQCRVELPAGERLNVLGIEGRLGQVFRNLITNAISFSPPGGMIRLSAQAPKGRGLDNSGAIVIEVADEGPGIPESKLEAIFDRFYSERPQDEKFGTHSGLGLSISKQIVEAHGGTIMAANRSGGGACFTVRLPAG